MLASRSRLHHGALVNSSRVQPQRFLPPSPPLLRRVGNHPSRASRMRSMWLILDCKTSHSPDRISWRSAGRWCRPSGPSVWDPHRRHTDIRPFVSGTWWTSSLLPARTAAAVDTSLQAAAELSAARRQCERNAIGTGTEPHRPSFHPMPGSVQWRGLLPSFPNRRNQGRLSSRRPSAGSTGDVVYRGLELGGATGRVRWDANRPRPEQTDADPNDGKHRHPSVVEDQRKLYNTAGIRDFPSTSFKIATEGLGNDNRERHAESELMDGGTHHRRGWRNRQTRSIWSAAKRDDCHKRQVRAQAAIRMEDHIDRSPR